MFLFLKQMDVIAKKGYLKSRNAEISGTDTIRAYSGNSFSQQVFGAAPYGALFNAENQVFIAGKGGVLLNISGDNLKINGFTGLQGFIKQMVSNQSGYTALVTPDQYSNQGNLYSSTDGYSWTQISS